jgi:hypothetical protein
MRKSVSSENGVSKEESRGKRTRERRARRPAIKLPAIKLPAYRKKSAGLVALASIGILVCLAGTFSVLSGFGPGAGRATETSAAASLLTTIMALPTSTVPVTPEPEEACVFRVRSGDAIGAVFADFILSLYQYKGPYFYFEQCTAGQMPFTCTLKKVIPDPDNIEPGWWIEIPGVGPEACADNRGRWALITE